MFDSDKDSADEIRLIPNDGAMLIQYLNVKIVDHHELRKLMFVHFELMVKLFLYVEHDVGHI